MTGSLGMLASTLPVQWLLPMLGWRGLFWWVAGLLLIAMVGGIWVAREQHMKDILIERETAEHSDDQPIQEELPLGEATEGH